MSKFSKLTETCKEFIKVEGDASAKKDGRYGQCKADFVKALRVYLDARVKEGIEIIIKESKNLTWQCNKCDKKFKGDNYKPCPHCGEVDDVDLLEGSSI